MFNVDECWDYAVGCDFNGNDIESENSTKDDCVELCKSTQGCTHYSWSNGICYKKSGFVFKPNAYIREDYVCGLKNSE